MKETYKVFIGDSQVADSVSAHEDLRKIMRESDEETRQAALSELAEKIKTKDGKSIAEQAIDSLEIIKMKRPSIGVPNDSDLRDEMLTTLKQDKEEAVKSLTEGGFYVDFNEDGEVINLGWSSKGHRVPESEVAATKKKMDKVPYGPKQNRTSFRRRSDGNGKNDKK
jgi:hypothetical protein